MATLAIEGHKTRGKEVIEIFEMLGGKNQIGYSADCDSAYFYIGSNSKNIYFFWFDNQGSDKDFTIYGLEEFLEKYPYKIGDKVSSKYLKNYKIEKMEWNATNNKVIYKLQGMGWYNTNELRPYKEETMEENNEKSANHVFDTEVITFDIAQRDKYELDLQGKFQVVLREGKYYVERIKPKYPKTYEECCKVLGYSGNYNMILTTDVDNKLFNALYRLKVCRDAYWKIYGEEKGLGKPWKPNWKDGSDKYFICYLKDELWMSNIRDCNRFLVFPTKEIRDAYKENFNDDIEICKELL